MSAAAAKKPATEKAPRIELKAGALRTALGQVLGAIEARNTIPILSNVLIEASDGCMTLTATNLDQMISVQVNDVMVPARVRITAEAKRLDAILRTVGEAAMISLEVGERMLIVRSGRAKWKVPTLPAEDFPIMMPTVRETEPLRFEPASTLAGLIDRVTYAISNEESRYYLCGILLHSEAERLALAATDGKALARKLGPALDDFKVDDGILPAKACALIAKLLAGRAGEATLAWTRAKVIMQCGGITLMSKMVDGVFPDYRRVIPPEAGTPIGFAVDDLEVAIARATAGISAKTVSLRMEAAGGALNVSARDDAGGGGEEDIAAEVDGDPIIFGINARYARDTIAHARGKHVTVRATTPTAATRWTVDGEDDFVGVIMPMTVFGG